MELGCFLCSEAIDDPSLSVSPVKCEDTCPEMASEISDVTEQQHVTLITQDGASQVCIFFIQSVLSLLHFFI